METSTDLRYPIGRFDFPKAPVTPRQLASWIAEVAQAPRALRDSVENLDEARLATPYRPGGWTVRQLVHHLADSHMNAYIRFKLALTEDRPTIKPYDEAAWANLEDSSTVPVAVSLDLLEGIHIRWLALLRAMRPEQMERGFVHPEHGRFMRLDAALGLYAWHGRHHVAHVTALREREGW